MKCFTSFIVDTKPDKKKVLAKVTYDYTPQHDDEIGLTIGEVIEVTKQVDFLLLIYNYS